MRGGDMESQAPKNCGHEWQEEEEEQHFFYAMQLVSSVSLPMVLNAAVRLGLFEIIAGAGPGVRLSPTEIAVRMSPPPPKTGSRNEISNPNAASMLDRMLRLLASHSMLTCSSVDDGGSQRVYGLAPVAKYFVRMRKEFPWPLTGVDCGQSLH